MAVSDIVHMQTFSSNCLEVKDEESDHFFKGVLNKAKLLCVLSVPGMGST